MGKLEIVLITFVLAIIIAMMGAIWFFYDNTELEENRVCVKTERQANPPVFMKIGNAFVPIQSGFHDSCVEWKP